MKRDIDVGFKYMTPDEKQYRIKYLWHRARICYNVIRFVNTLRDNVAWHEEIENLQDASYMEHEETEKEDIGKICFCFTFEELTTLWLCLISFVHWVNLVLTPIIMLWPMLFPSPSYTLWLVEILFLCDILRKCVLKKPKSLATDSYDIFVEYLRTTMFIDLIALIPSIFSGMNH